MAIKTANKVGTCCIIIKLIVILAAAWVIRSEYLPDGGVQWLPVKPWSCCMKWPAMEVHSFAVAAYFNCCNHS